MSSSSELIIVEPDASPPGFRRKRLLHRFKLFVRKRVVDSLLHHPHRSHSTNLAVERQARVEGLPIAIETNAGRVDPHLHRLIICRDVSGKKCKLPTVDRLLVGNHLPDLFVTENPACIFHPIGRDDKNNQSGALSFGERGQPGPSITDRSPDGIQQRGIASWLQRIPWTRCRLDTPKDRFVLVVELYQRN